MFRTEPKAVRVLKYLRVAKGECSEEKIARVLKERRDEISNILEELKKKGLVEVEESGSTSYYKTKKGVKEVIDKILKIYDGVTEKVSKKMLLVGVLSAFSPLRFSTLIKVFEEFGFAKGEVEEFIENEVKEERIKKIKAVCVGEIYSGSRFFPVGFYTNGGISEEEAVKRIKMYYKSLGLEGAMYEEVLLMGKYPPKLAKAGREYLNRRKDVKERVRKEVPPIFRWTPLGFDSYFKKRDFF